MEVTYRALGDHVSLLIFLRINHLDLMSLFHFVFFKLHQGTRSRYLKVDIHSGKLLLLDRN